MSANSDKVEPLTPYQGRHRTFGLFDCEDCNISWSSAWSWANSSQKCRTCGNDVYPHRQFKLKRGKGKAEDVKKRHMINLCGKCTELAAPCTNHPTHPPSKGRRRRHRRRGQANQPAAPAPAVKEY